MRHGSMPGLMDNDEEKKLAQFLKDSAAIGYRVEVMNIAESSAKKKGTLRKDKISPGWSEKFSKRQGNLRGDNTANKCMDAANADTMSHYENLL